MNAAPLLRKLLDQAGGADASGYLLVLQGEGLEDLPAALDTARGTYSIHRPTTEIGLRHMLWRAKGAPLIAVLPEALARRLPYEAVDLLRRARNQRVHALAVNDILSVVLGVRVVGAEASYLESLALENVDRLGDALGKRTLPTVVDRRLLEDLLLEVLLPGSFESSSPARLLADWIESPPAWSDALGQLVVEALPAKHGDEGRLLAWALSNSDGLKSLVVHGALLSVEGEQVSKDAWGPLWVAAAEPPIQLDRQLVRSVACRLVEGALVILGDKAASLLDEADSLGRRHLTPNVLQTSRLLPLAFWDRAADIAKRAAAGKMIPAGEIARLRTYRAAALGHAELELVDAMARLTRYLDQPSQVPADVVSAVRRYQQDGAFADRVVRQAERALAATARFHDEARGLIAKVRARRDDENLRFAQILTQGYEAHLHKTGLVPLHRVFKWTVAEPWQKDPDAKLFVIVLDGCSYPVFLELLGELAQDASFPLGLAADGEGRVQGLLGLAPLPTITSHARGAIFLGELPHDPLVAETVWRDQEEAKTDKARFNQNAALGKRTRALFLKGDLADGGQGLLAALDAGGPDVVAAVFNAVDDQIGSSNTGAQVRISAAEITAFKPSLRAALKAGRRVLLTADHGHTPFVDKGLRLGNANAARFRELGPAETPPDGTIEIDLAGLGGPPGRRAFAWKSGAYFGNPQFGFHGGCSLEEMVVPLAWLVRDGLAADEPSWWFAGGATVELPKPYAPPEPVRTPVPAKLPPPNLFEPATRADVLGLAPEVLTKLGEDERAVLVLLAENGSAKTTELATRLGKTPMRINGLVAHLRRTLSAAGCLCFTDEVLPTGETQYRYTKA